MEISILDGNDMANEFVKVINRICNACNITEKELRYKYLPDWWPMGEEEDDLVLNPSALSHGLLILAKSFNLSYYDLLNENSELNPDPTINFESEYINWIANIQCELCEIENAVYFPLCEVKGKHRHLDVCNECRNKIPYEILPIEANFTEKPLEQSQLV